MKLADLPNEVIDDLCQEDKWRLDIDPGFDAKHEFWMSWRHFLSLPESSPYYQMSEDDLAEMLNFNGFNILLPVSRSHHPSIELSPLCLHRARPDVNGQ